MASDQHIGDQLSAYLGGALVSPERDEIERHLSGCTACADEAALLREARSILAPLPEQDARPGFALRVASLAAEKHVHPLGAPWWRWAFGGAAVAGLAGLVLAVSLGRGGAPARSEELLLAQRLDLYEDMTVMQNQEALEDLDVVSVLHTLQPEGAP